MVVLPPFNVFLLYSYCIVNRTKQDTIETNDTVPWKAILRTVTTITKQQQKP